MPPPPCRLHATRTSTPMAPPQPLHLAGQPSSIMRHYNHAAMAPPPKRLLPSVTPENLVRHHHHHVIIAFSLLGHHASRGPPATKIRNKIIPIDFASSSLHPARVEFACCESRVRTFEPSSIIAGAPQAFSCMESSPPSCYRYDNIHITIIRPLLPPLTCHQVLIRSSILDHQRSLHGAEAQVFLLSASYNPNWVRKRAATW
ncbi:hypothetical protein LR48_Vigan11g106500 [Vigna angularis]|uniref:Uncharacterized protein n=1 Tax=Phaseolus angularis TaxID=3914 RepID=A0A0L9VT58_PHAAN|nr:hypothetical protein LR48_Vigan11g106500 [Vigna angularis]